MLWPSLAPIRIFLIALYFTVPLVHGVISASSGMHHVALNQFNTIFSDLLWAFISAHLKLTRSNWRYTMTNDFAGGEARSLLPLGFQEQQEFSNRGVKPT